MAFNVGLDHHPGHGGEDFEPTRTGLDHVCFLVDGRDQLDLWAGHLDREAVEHFGVVEVEGAPFAVLNLRDRDGIALELMAGL